MKQTIIILHGAPFSGKTKVTEILRVNRGARPVYTKKLLEENKPEVAQQLVAGSIVQDDVMIPLLEQHWPTNSLVVVDSLRSLSQVNWVRDFPGTDADIYTLHLVIDVDEIYRRLHKASETERGNRQDDNIKVLKKRLDVFEIYSRELLRPLWRISRAIEEVDANKTVDHVAHHVLSFCDKHRIAMAEPPQDLGDHWSAAVA